ncbi:PAS domain-containing protein [Polyangium aurulentum]|uniref:PAS domain-containing protein n=1 Tax=Polyangium aurulentum TaxID=2567896 RepID=UPI0010AEE068|nr:PAS domain-containing protein [Polyangium aurulentum]UQA60826.1 PAS domain-containing protein [Polyangium aurulentum]
MQPSDPQDIAVLQARIAELERHLAERSAPPDGHARFARDGDDELLHAALASVAEGMIVCDAGGRIVHYNAAVVSLYGMGAADLRPDQWSDGFGIYSPDGASMIPQEQLPLARALRGEHVDRMEVCVRAKGASKLMWHEASARPIRAKDGTLRGAVVVFRDITERRWREHERGLRLNAEAERIAAEKERVQQGRMLRLLLDHLDIVIWAVDDKGVFTFQEGKGLAAAGMHPGQLVGKASVDIYGPEAASGIVGAVNGRSSHRTEEAHGVFWENWYIPVQEDDGKPAGAIGFSLDVSAWHRTKAELESKLALIERQQEVIRNLETPIIQVWDKVITLPMVGVVDSRRAARVMEDLLASVTRTQARFAILDLTGVDIVDTSTAGHLIQMIEAVRLLGAEGIITGIRPNVAQTVVTLGLDMSRVTTLATLRDGLALCIRRLSAARKGL